MNIKELKRLLTTYVEDNLTKAGITDYVFETNKYSGETSEDVLFYIDSLDEDTFSFTYRNDDNFRIEDPLITKIYVEPNIEVDILSIDVESSTFFVDETNFNKINLQDNFVISLGTNINTIYIIIDIDYNSRNLPNLATDKLIVTNLPLTILVGCKNYELKGNLFEKLLQEIEEMFSVPILTLRIDACHVLRIQLPSGISSGKSVKSVTDIVAYINVFLKIYEERKY